LALRNILLTKTFVVKIADFGLSRLTEDDNYVHNSKNPKLPFKWLPIDALSTNSTPLKSDLWTFGVLLWELFTLCGKPYKEMTPWQYKAFIESGKRLDKPPFAPMEMYFSVR
jgi:serine/threonine protein kinase